MNICHIILTFNFAGSERYCSDLANFQSNHGDNVSVVILDQKKNVNNITHHIIDKVDIIYIRPFFKSFQIKKILKQKKIDIVHAHLGNACKSIKNIVIPKVVTLHIDFRKKQHENFDGIICINQNQYNNISSHKASKILIYNWIPKIIPFTDSKYKNIKKKLFGDEKVFIFGNFGRFNKSKNLDLLINAFISIDNPRYRLLLIGDGEERNQLIRLSSKDKRIKILENQIDIYPFYEVIDCFVLTSIFEPFGLVIAEAMHFEKDIICSEVPISELLPEDSIYRNNSKDQLIELMTIKAEQKNKKCTYDIKLLNRESQISKINNFYKYLLTGDKSN